MNDQELEKLKSLTFFQPLTLEEIKELTSIMEEKTYAEKEKVIKRGHPGDMLYVIKSGTVSITVEKDGKDNEIAGLFIGDFFGEIAFFADVLRTATVVADKRTVLLEIPRTKFNEFIFKQPTIGVKILYHIVGTMAKRLRVVLRGA